MRSRVSSGIVLFRRSNGPLEVLLAHPGGPYFAHKDEGHWTIPKGEVDADDVPAAVSAAADRGRADGAAPGAGGADGATPGVGGADGAPHGARGADGGRPPGAAAAGRADSAPDLLAVARREFAEETGHPAPDGEPIELGSIVQKGGKVVHAWALEGDLDPAKAVSNTFELAWPPGSGRMTIVPEIDRVEWFDPAQARRRIKATQIPLLDRLEAILQEG